MITCRTCGHEKQSTEYHKGKRICKTCRSIERAQRYQDNKKFENLTKKLWRIRNPAKTRAIDALRRTRMRVEYEEFHYEEIFQRDKWICGICGEAVAREIEYPHPQCASLDHIVPLSLGGGHTRKNTQLAHLVCNMKKGNKHDM